MPGKASIVCAVEMLINIFSFCAIQKTEISPIQNVPNFGIELEPLPSESIVNSEEIHVITPPDSVFQEVSMIYWFLCVSVCLSKNFNLHITVLAH